MTNHFSKKILGSRISLTYKRLMKILRQTKEKSYKNLTKFRKLGPRFPQALVFESRASVSVVMPKFTGVE